MELVDTWNNNIYMQGAAQSKNYNSDMFIVKYC